MMSKPIFQPILASTALMFVSACSTAYEPSRYVGVYQSEPDSNAYIQVKDIDGKLFFYTTQGVMEAQLGGRRDYKLVNVYAEGEFENLKDGKYQTIVNTDYAYRVKYNRVELPDGKNLETIHHGNLYAKNIATTAQAECANEFPFTKSLSYNTKLQGLWDDIESGTYGRINSVLVLKSGDLIAEKYFNGFNASEKQTVQSVSKSIVSLLAGSAIEEGYIDSVNAPIKPFFPKYSAHFTEGKEAITLKHLLAMKAGWKWDEWSTHYSDANNPRSSQMTADDTIEYVFKLPLTNTPGEHFAYSGGVVDVTAELIKNATKKESAADYFVQSRLKDLCIKNASWLTMGDGRMAAGGGMLLRPRDLLKFGQLVLNKGEWQGKQLLSSEWIEESTRGPNYPYAATYGYYWWNDVLLANRKRHTAVFASGWGDQSIYTFEDLDLVIVTTGFNFEKGTQSQNIVRQHILPTVLKK